MATLQSQIRISVFFFFFFFFFSMQFYKFHANSSPLLDFNLLSASSSNFDLFYVSYKTY